MARSSPLTDAACMRNLRRLAPRRSLGLHAVREASSFCAPQIRAKFSPSGRSTNPKALMNRGHSMHNFFRSGGGLIGGVLRLHPLKKARKNPEDLERQDLNSSFALAIQRIPGRSGRAGLVLTQSLAQARSVLR